MKPELCYLLKLKKAILDSFLRRLLALHSDQSIGSKEVKIKRKISRLSGLKITDSDSYHRRLISSPLCLQLRSKGLNEA
ncbi:hypothetical protein L596_025599 [Steinernema carpocapsae]|uniref:Uncharacterized protein n=1 Tax=Steinernema carpocapsae TaxID=34508 RepID=A0A4U5M887_STECR|nr:hypothetical protein L596_025599 [Steinernema carpocapsae]